MLTVNITTPNWNSAVRDPVRWVRCRLVNYRLPLESVNRIGDIAKSQSRLVYEQNRAWSLLIAVWGAPGLGLVPVLTCTRVIFHLYCNNSVMRQTWTTTCLCGLKFRWIWHITDRIISQRQTKNPTSTPNDDDDMVRRIRCFSQRDKTSLYIGSWTVFQCDSLSVRLLMKLLYSSFPFNAKSSHLNVFTLMEICISVNSRNNF